MTRHTAEQLRARSVKLLEMLRKLNIDKNPGLLRTLLRGSVWYLGGAALWIASPAASVAVTVTFVLREVLTNTAGYLESSNFAKADLALMSKEERAHISAVWRRRGMWASQRGAAVLALAAGAGLAPAVSFVGRGMTTDETLTLLQGVNICCTILGFGLAFGGLRAVWFKPLLKKLETAP